MTPYQDIVVVGSVIVWSAIWWRFRGGALTAITGWDPGTGGMRALAAVGMTAPLIAIGGLWWALLAPALWAGWSLAGWGAFQGVGQSPVGDKNPLERFLAGFLAPVPMCLVGMAAEGVYCLLLPGVAVGWAAGSWLVGILVPLVGLGFAPIYYFAQGRASLPDLGRFEHAGSELAEVLVGAWVGLVFATIAVLA